MSKYTEMTREELFAEAIISDIKIQTAMLQQILNAIERIKGEQK